MIPFIVPEIAVLNAVSVNTVSSAIDISDYDVISINLFATSAATSDATIKVYISNSEDAVTIGTPSATNMYGRVAIKDLGTETSYTESSEFTLGASATHNRIFNVNTDGARKMWIEVAGVAGTVAVTATVSGRKVS